MGIVVWENGESGMEIGKGGRLFEGYHDLEDLAVEVKFKAKVKAESESESKDEAITAE